MQQTKLKLHSVNWVSTIMYNWASGPSQITNKLKHLCEKYDDGSMNIPNFLNVIANII